MKGCTTEKDFPEPGVPITMDARNGICYSLLMTGKIWVTGVSAVAFNEV